MEDDTVVSYLLSAEYRAENELTLSVFDEEIGLRLPAGPPPILSERDRTARTLGEAAAASLLPEYTS
ncbi:dTDP-4-dehydrorhamnose 3,5-epimerase family protein [Nonomuraea ferruginea]